LVIKQGHAESGTHEELLEKSVSYADLYRRQFREPAPTAPG
jgi:ABC-type multidrug transport system fused ATPase/permease subunit